MKNPLPLFMYNNHLPICAASEDSNTLTNSINNSQDKTSLKKCVNQLSSSSNASNNSNYFNNEPCPDLKINSATQDEKFYQNINYKIDPSINDLLKNQINDLSELYKQTYFKFETDQFAHMLNVDNEQTPSSNN